VRYFQQGQSQAAVYQFQQALSANPRNPDACYNLAAAYHYLGKQNSDTALLGQAENLYHQCLDLSPDHVPCHRALAVLLVDTNRPQSAFTLLERWSTRSPQLADPRIELARLHEEFGEADAARRYLGEAIDVDPTNSRAWTALARLRESEGQYAQALSNYQQAYMLNSQQPLVAQQITSLQQRLAMGATPNAANTRTVEVPRGWTAR
jgi:tetratricopeptide (TPR) repeat protein